MALLHHGDVVANSTHWNDAETRHLINIWREPDVLAEVRDTTSKHKTVYRRIAKRIAAEGYYRDEGQIKNKIRTMTTNYRRLAKMNHQDRSNFTGQGKQTFLYFHELHEFVDVDLENVIDGADSNCTTAVTAIELDETEVDEQDESSPDPRSQVPSNISSRTPVTQLGTIKLENSHQRQQVPRQVPATSGGSSFNRTNIEDVNKTSKYSRPSEGASLLHDGPSHHQTRRLSSDEEFDDEDSQEMPNHPMVDGGWISDGDDIHCGEPKAKLKCKADIRLNPANSKRDRTKSAKKDEIKDLVKMLMENNMQRDKVLMQAEDAHRRMEAERHTEEIRLLRDQIQLERDRLQFEREERERKELIRREEAARSERLRREEMERAEKARLDERDREERRFTLMMALIKGAQNHSNQLP